MQAFQLHQRGCALLDAGLIDLEQKIERLIGESSENQQGFVSLRTGSSALLQGREVRQVPVELLCVPVAIQAIADSSGVWSLSDHCPRERVPSTKLQHFLDDVTRRLHGPAGLRALRDVGLLLYLQDHPLMSSDTFKELIRRMAETRAVSVSSLSLKARLVMDAIFPSSGE